MSEECCGSKIPCSTSMPGPTAEHRRYEALAGSWRGTEKLYPSPWDPKGGEATGTFTSRLDLGGLFFVTDYVQHRGGQETFRGHGVYGWDPKEGVPTMAWFDSMTPSGRASVASGRWDGDTLTFVHQGEMGWGRSVYTLTGKDTFRFRLDHSRDGKEWQTFMEGDYRRA